MLLSDPLGSGSDLLGTAGRSPAVGLIEPTLVATVQAVSIVVGHLLGVLAAHERAVTVLDRRAAVVGQVPLMVVMLGYTLVGLTLLFTPDRGGPAGRPPGEALRQWDPGEEARPT